MTNTSLLAIFTFSFVLGIGAVISPGPVSTAIVSQAPRHGWKVGPLIATGHSLLELLIVLALAFGLQSLLTQPFIESGIALLGGALLIWMGISMLRGVYRKEFSLSKNLSLQETRSASQLVYLGMLTTLANPFWYAWWVTVPPTYLAQASSIGLLPLAAFYFGHISADYIWDSFLASLMSGGGRWISDRIYASIISLCALFFLYLGASFILRGIALLQTLTN